MPEAPKVTLQLLSPAGSVWYKVSLQHRMAPLYQLVPLGAHTMALSSQGDISLRSVTRLSRNKHYAS